MKLKISSDKQKEIVAELEKDKKVWAGFNGSRNFRACETLVKNNPECLQLKYELKKDHIMKSSKAMVYLIYKKTRLANG